MNTAPEVLDSKADHGPYIEAVRAALLLEEIRADAAVLGTRPMRAATMALTPPDDDADEPWHHTFATAERVELRWTEEEGWSLRALHAVGDDRHLPTVWRPGHGVMLPANEIITWLAVLLTMPGVSPSQEDGPYRSHRADDPAFEASLAFYTL